MGTASFPDHHRFTQRERDDIENQARAAGADLLICTEKDVHNLGGTTGSMPLHACAISLTISDADNLVGAIDAAIQKRGVPA